MVKSAVARFLNPEQSAEPMTKLPARIRIGDHVYLENIP